MSMIKKMATASAVAVMGLGLGAASASAYAITGGSYSGTATNDHSFTVGGAYTIVCPAADTTFTGSATGTDTTHFTPAYGSNCNFFGLPAQVTQSGTWSIKVNGGPTSGFYTGLIHIPASSTTTIEVPLAGCTVTVTGTQQFQHGTGGNIGQARNVTPTGVQLQANVKGISYTASGCPFSSAADGEYNTNGFVDISGITIS